MQYLLKTDIQLSCYICKKILLSKTTIYIYFLHLLNLSWFQYQTKVLASIVTICIIAWFWIYFIIKNKKNIHLVLIKKYILTENYFFNESKILTNNVLKIILKLIDVVKYIYMINCGNSCVKSLVKDLKWNFITTNHHNQCWPWRGGDGWGQVKG